MRPLLLVTVLGCFACAERAPAQDAARFSDGGITFDYPKSWKVNTEKPAGILSVTVMNDKGTQALVQVHPAGTDPKSVRDVMEKSFRKAFEGKLVAGSEKAAKRKIAGAEQEGVAMDFEVAAGVAIHFEVLAFPLPSKKVVCAVFQHSGFDADAATKGFDLIAGSLADAGGAKTAATPKKAAEMKKSPETDTPAKSIVMIRPPTPGGWSFKVAKPGVRIWSDRDYTLTKLPKELEGGALWQRGAADGKSWLPSGKFTVTQDGTAYAIVRTKVMGKVQVPDEVFGKLAGEGWSEVAGPAETTFPRGEAWEWKVIKRDIKKGEEIGVLKSLTWDQPIVFVFK